MWKAQTERTQNETFFHFKLCMDCMCKNNMGITLRQKQLLSFLLLPRLSINTQALSSQKHVYTFTPPSYTLFFRAPSSQSESSFPSHSPLSLNCNVAFIPCVLFFPVSWSKFQNLPPQPPQLPLLFFKARNHSRCFVKEKIRSFFSPFPQNTTVHRVSWVNRVCLHQQAVSSSFRTWLCTRDTPGTSRNRWWGFFRRRKVNCMCLFCSWQSIHMVIGWSFNFFDFQNTKDFLLLHNINVPELEPDRGYLHILVLNGHGGRDMSSLLNAHGNAKENWPTFQKCMFVCWCNCQPEPHL